MVNLTTSVTNKQMECDFINWTLIGLIVPTLKRPTIKYFSSETVILKKTKHFVNCCFTTFFIESVSIKTETN